MEYLRKQDRSALNSHDMHKVEPRRNQKYTLHRDDVESSKQIVYVGLTIRLR